MKRIICFFTVDLFFLNLLKDDYLRQRIRFSNMNRKR